MRAMKQQGIFLLVVGLFLLSILSPCGQEKQGAPLPRELGPIRLGMTRDALDRILGESPSGPSFWPEAMYPHVPYEIEVAKHQKIFRGKLPSSAYIDCLFFANQLFQISFGCEFTRIEDAKKDYKKRYGPVSEVKNWPVGISWLIWENKTTLLKISYVGKRDDYYPILDSPVGTIINVYYVDKTIQSVRWKSPIRPNPTLDLPRSFGPLVLGMSVDTFTAITGFDPRSVWCASCAVGELLADLALTKKEAKRFNSTYFTSSTMGLMYQSKDLMPEQVGCRFIRGRLYSIEMWPITGNAQSVLRGYEVVLGKPTWSMKQNDGTNVLIWESPSTRLQLVYSAMATGKDYMQIQYCDMDLLRRWPPPEIK